MMMSEEGDFRGRISHRLSLIFGFLFLVVLLVGGVSLYLARSIFISTEEIRRESEQIDLVDRIHSAIHHFVSALQRAILHRGTVPDSERIAYLKELDTLLERYQEAGKGEKEITREIRQIIAEHVSVSDKITRQNQRPATAGGPALNPGDLEALVAGERKIVVIAHRLSMPHKAKMEQIARESRWRMQIILGFFAAFVFVGVILLAGSSLFFSRAIAQPLRQLAQAASEIAQGNLQRQVPVTSKDEIGQLSHAFNVMAERLREHEERLKGLAALEERGRIAQELHDSLAQEIALLHLKIIEADQALSDDDVSGAKETLEEMRKIAAGAYEDVRQAIFGLRTMVSKRLGFIPSLTEYLHEFSELRQIPVDLKADGLELIRLSPQVEIQLVRIIHEALTNVYKHAGAKKAVVRFDPDGEFAKVTIEDNGKGFQMEEVIGKRLHFGLQTMRERVEGVGGKFAVETSPGRGTRVIVHLPLDEKGYETDSSASD
jgi:two-component system sensor histidine kinase DegS